MRYYITTAIPYINTEPHLGFAWEIIIADVLARYFRLKGNEVKFVTGTDENSIKTVQSAEKENLTPQQLADRNAQKFYELKELLNLSFDDFIRTSQERHKKAVQLFWLKNKNNFVFKKYQGRYCSGCEAFYKEEELVEGKICPLHQKEAEYLEEENYFFQLEKFLPKIKEILISKELKIIPENKANEILEILNSKKIKEFSASRPKKRMSGWGIEVPDNPDQIIYVWFDALVNYLSVLGFDQGDDFKKFWLDEKTKIIHIIGKDVVKFHALYWPGMLMGVNLRLPSIILVHEFVLNQGQKMSKSLKNFITPYQVLAKYPNVDILRLYFLYQSPFYSDFNFSWGSLNQFAVDILREKLGNLVQRILGLAKKYQKKIEIQKYSNQFEDFSRSWQNYHSFFEQFDPFRALRETFNLVSKLNKFIDQRRVWANLNEENLAYLVLGIGHIGWQIRPFAEETSKKILNALGFEGKKNWAVFVPPVELPPVLFSKN